MKTMNRVKNFRKVCMDTPDGFVRKWARRQRLWISGHFALKTQREPNARSTRNSRDPLPLIFTQLFCNMGVAHNRLDLLTAPFRA
jgi:hypothetical protein